MEIKSAMTWRDTLAGSGRAFMHDNPSAFEPTVVYDGDDLDLSSGISVRNIRSFRV